MNQSEFVANTRNLFKAGENRAYTVRFVFLLIDIKTGLIFLSQPLRSERNRVITSR